MSQIAIISRDAESIRRGIKPEQITQPFESVAEAEAAISEKPNPKDWTWVRLT